MAGHIMGHGRRASDERSGRHAWVVAACAIAFAGAAHAACDQPAGRLAAIEGLVEVRAGVHGPWQPAGLRQMLCPGDQVAVRGPGRAAIALAQDVLVRLDQNTTLTLPGSPTRADTELGLTGGVVHVISRFRKRLGVLTPVVNALVDGTEFVVADGDGRARVSVAEGHVRAVTGAGELSLGAGEATDVADGAAPGPALVVSPLDAVRWAIHYPQVVRPPADALAADPVLRTAVSLAEAGRFRAALDTLGDGGPPAFRAALFLGLGRADEARGVLSAATPEAGVAAVRAVIQVARNDAEALATARDAVRSDPASAPARLALSYALQADRQVPAALAAAESATALRPDDPVAWARRAELELALSRLAAGRESARRALALNPAVPRARALAAFAELLAGRTDAAAGAFDALLADDGSEPLAHLGRALAHLRQGEVAAGRQELEVAVLLDPSNAELRSALGRAYLEEDRDKVAGDQFELARRLDPASPTPWYFDAFRKLRNRDFLAAVADGEEAVARNESRGVLRSGELLDQDRAARSASLGEAYREVGFYGPMQARAMDALADDPQSPAAHRLLADAYAGVPRFETARVSELLQAELRQPIGQMPLPPQFVMPALPVLDGPRALSPDESTGLFARKPDHFAFSALGGNQDTGAASLVAAHAWERGQIGVGAFDYRSRALVAGDADTHLSGTRLTGQFALTPASSVFAELRHTERVSGDQTLSLFDADLKRLRDGVNSDLARVAFRMSRGIGEELLLEASTQQIRDRSSQSAHVDDPLNGSYDVLNGYSARLNARRFSAMYSVQRAESALIAGVTSFKLSGTADQNFDLSIPGFGVFPVFASTFSTRAGRDAAFGYSRWRLNPVVTFLTGAEYTRYDEPTVTKAERFSGKIGLLLQPRTGTMVRAALFQGVKGSKYDREGLEPTQFNGFNQVFDDFNGTRWTRGALAVDQHFAGGAALGAEVSSRHLDVPGLGCTGEACLAHWHEDLHRVYMALPFGTRVAASAEWRYENSHINDDPRQLSMFPYRLRTDLVPIRLWVKAGTGSINLENWAVRQNARMPDAFTGADLVGHSAFSVMNLRYSMPLIGKDVVASLGASNVFDRRFRFQNADYNGDPKAPLFYPRRTVLVQLTLRY